LIVGRIVVVRRAVVAEDCGDLPLADVDDTVDSEAGCVGWIAAAANAAETKVVRAAGVARVAEVAVVLPEASDLWRRRAVQVERAVLALKDAVPTTSPPR